MTPTGITRSFVDAFELVVVEFVVVVVETVLDVVVGVAEVAIDVVVDAAFALNERGDSGARCAAPADNNASKAAFENNASNRSEHKYKKRTTTMF